MFLQEHEKIKSLINRIEIIQYHNNLYISKSNSKFINSVKLMLCKYTLWILEYTIWMYTLDFDYTKKMNGIWVKEIKTWLHSLNRQYVCISFFPTLIPLSEVGTTCFLSCCDKDLAIIFTTGRLHDVKPPWNWSGYYDCKCNRDQRLNVPSEARRSSR
jgi:hypothetical protein